MCIDVQSTATENRQGKTRKKEYYIIMVALWNMADHYVLVLWFLLLLLLSFFLSFFLFSSPNLSHRRLDVCRLSTIAQLCRAISSQLRHISTIGKKLLSSNISSTCLHNMVNFGLLPAEICPVVWGTPANFNGFASWQGYCTAL